MDAFSHVNPMTQRQRLPKNSYCSYCGHLFENLAWPRRCNYCGQMTFQNPIPVAVTLLPAENGLVVVRRGVAPNAGKLALPGGFIDLGETWQQAAARELWEETQIAIHPDTIQLYQVHSAPDGTLLIFGLASPWPGSLPPFTPTVESPERCIITTPTELAFPLHTQIARAYFTALS